MTTVDVSPCDRELRRPFWRLQFQDDLDASYLKDVSNRRLKHNIVCIFALILLYDIAVIPDWLQSQETFVANAVLRLAVFTPFCLITIAILRRRPPLLLQEFFLGAVLVLTVLLETNSLVRSHFDADAAIYQLGGGLCCMMFAAVVMKTRFSTKVTVLCLMFALKANLIWFAPGSIGPAGRAIMTHAFASGVMMLLLAAFLLERADRRGYLQGMRASLLNDELKKAARTDGLTGLGNRHYLDEVGNAFFERATSSKLLSIVLIDIDHFKLFNDHHGHVEGDECLRKVSACVSSSLSNANQSAFRYGGEELLLFLPDTSSEQARDCAERVRHLLRERAIPHLGLPGRSWVTVSIGIATSEDSNNRLTDLINQADNALYQAKRSGRDRIWLHDPSPSTVPVKQRLGALEREFKAGTV